MSFAQEAASKSEHEPYPQSAKLARDRRAELVLETARVQLRQKDYAAALVALQELLDGPNAFAKGDTSSPSFVEEANRLLREMPAAARDAYERLNRAEANRLLEDARQNGRAEALRELVGRFGATTAGWFALRDLAARHSDHGEWRMAAAASQALARHSHSAVSRETSWIVRWVLAEARVSTTKNSARELLQTHRKLLEASPGPTGALDKNLAEWLVRQLSSASAVVLPADDWQAALESAPSGNNVFQHDVGLRGEPAGWLKDILDEGNRYDLPTLPSAQPLVVGDVVIARFVHPAKVIAVDARRGKLLWEQSLANPLGTTVTDLQRHPGIRTSLLDELQRRWFGDSVRGRMTTDGRRLFLVRDLDELDLKPGAGSRLRNHLEAWDVATGERRWRVGSSVNEPPTGFEGLYFLGPPLVSDGSLYVVAQRELQVALWVLRASDGQFEWTLPLAETDRQQFKETGWRHVACPVTWAGGRLICPTGAGCFVAVDPITRSLAWSVRFERDDINTATGFAAADRERPFPVRWWESWREVAVQDLKFEISNFKSQISNLKSQISQPAAADRQSNSLILLASPESRSLRAVDSQSGEVRWRVSFAEPLFLASRDAVVLVFERDKCTLLDAATGRETFSLPLGAPTGPGEWIGRKYVCPMPESNWAVIDSAEGKVRRSVDGFWWDFDVPKKETASEFDLSSGRMVRVGGRWAVQSPTRLGLFETIRDQQAEFVKTSGAKPDDVAAQIQLAKIAWQFADWDKAEKLLRPWLEKNATVASALRETLLRQVNDQPAEHARLAEELLRLSPAPQMQFEAQRALLQAARERGDMVAALRHVLGLLDPPLVDDLRLRSKVPPLPDPYVQPDGLLDVRRDRWAQGVIADLFAQSDEATRKKLEAVLAEWRQRAADSLDAFALLTLTDQLACLPLGRELRLQLSGRTGAGVGFLKTSLALREIAQAGDRAEAAEAWYRLALLHDFRSEPLDAADCYRELRDRFADVKLSDGRGAAEWLADVMPDSVIGRALSDESRDPWPNVMPKITSQEELHDDIYCYPIPLASRDPFWRRLTVCVERQGRKVRFHGAGQRGFWELPLPASNSPFRHASDMHRGWGLGPLLVLQVGEDLLGIQPLDERGETNAKLLWTINVGPYEEIGAHQFLPGRVGIRPDDFAYLDRYEQPVLDVVHARSGLLCYRNRNRLIAIDPANGARLWARHSLPPLASVSGDGEHILLRLNAACECEVRSAFDGRLLIRRTHDSDPKGIVLELGRRRVVMDSLNPDKGDSAATSLTVLDQVTDRTLWQTKVPPRSVLLQVDESRLGVIEPNGTLRFLSLETERELAKHQVPMPASLSTAQVFGDDLRLFVLLAGPVTEQRWLATQQDRGSYRKPLVNGWLHAFDRRSLRLLWTIPTTNLPIAIDQPQDTPFLLLTYKRPSDDSTDGQNPNGVLHLIDKRTGKDLLYDVGNPNNVYVALEPDPLQLRVDLLTQKRRIRLDYAAE